MSQQINLFNPNFLAQKKVFSAKAMAEALGALLFGCIALGVYGQHNSSVLAQEAAAGAAQLAQKQARLDKVAIEYAPRQKSKTLELELAGLDAKSVVLREAASAIEKGELGNRTGYAGAFKALARQSMSGLWLTGVQIEGRGTRMGLQGRALDAALVPAYLGRLGREPLLQGKSFASMRIGQPKTSKENNTAFVEFSVGTAAAAAEVTR